VLELRREYPTRPLVGAGAVVRKGSRVLLLKRRFPPNEGIWALPGGLVELAESPAEAAVREVEEETGFRVRLDRLLDVASDVHLDGQGKVKYHYILIDYLATPVGGSLTPNSESLDCRWFKRSELAGLEMGESTRRVLEICFGRSSLTGRRRQRKRSPSR
jgi:8-oxo-dGTP diphosphatase